MSFAHALLMAELLVKAINASDPTTPPAARPTMRAPIQEPSLMDDQTSTAPADPTPAATPAAMTEPATTPVAPLSETPTTAEPSSLPTTSSGDPSGDLHALIGDIAQLVQIFDKKPEIFDFLRGLMIK